MNALRQLGQRKALATWMMLACALVMKAIVPAGFMPMMTANGLEMVLCSGMAATGSADVTVKPMMPGMAHEILPPQPHGAHDPAPAPAKSETPCAFTGLTAPTVGGADLMLLAIAVIAIVVAARLFRPIAPIAPLCHLRPPLRGPPATG